MSVEDTINDKIKIGIIGALGEIPEVGGLFALIVEEFWPDPERQDVWTEMKERVETLLNEKLSDLVYNDINASLKGLARNSAGYAQALSDDPDNKSLISQKWNVAKGDFNQQEPHFQVEGYKLLLLPLFAQMANMHLSLIREGCIHGKSWGWSDKFVQDLKKEFTDTIKEYVKHVDDTYNKGLTDKNTKASEILNGSDIERWTRSFNVVNDFKREMTISVLDYRQMWPYMDISKYPNPVYMLLTREVYSNAQPRAYRTIVPRPEPTGKILTSCRIRWGSGGKIDSVTPSYNGVEMPPMGGDWVYSDYVLDRSMLDRLTSVTVCDWDAVWALAFQFENQKDPVIIGDRAGHNWMRTVEPPPGHYFSSILASPDPMTTGHQDLVRAMYFGFKLKRKPIFDLPQTPDPNTFSPDIPGVLVSGGFPTEPGFKDKPLDWQRNGLISTLNQYIKGAELRQGKSNYELIGACAVLGLLRLAKLATDEQLKALDEDGLHNTIIVAIGSRTQPTRPLGWWQSLTNLELAVLARGLA